MCYISYITDQKRRTHAIPNNEKSCMNRSENNYPFKSVRCYAVQFVVLLSNRVC